MNHRSLAWWTLFVTVTGCSPPLSADETGESGLGLTGHTGLAPGAAPVSIPAAVLTALSAGRPVDIIVRLDDSLMPAVQTQRGTAARRTSVEDRAVAWSVLNEHFVRDLPVGATATRTFRNIPVIAVRVDDAAALHELAARSDVVSIDPNVEHTTSLVESLALIGQPAAELGGFTGSGVSVAVLDTGANWAHADLGSCSAVATGPSCRVVFAQDFAPSDGSVDDNGHGTNVSATVAAVAPDADIIALDVFDGAGAWSTDIIEAIDWVVDNQATYDIAAINMSLGSGKYTAPCVDVFSAAVQSANAAGVSVVVASGNSAYTDGISSPACVDEAVSVGAVYDADLGTKVWSSCSDATTAADKVACFSNSASFLDILAPGAMVTAGGYTMGGTSMASPHVAGAIAVLRAADPSATVEELETQLALSGVPITDTRNGLSFPRLDLETAVDGPIVIPDGSVVINSGAAGTKLTAVTLTLSSTTADTMCVSNTGTCTTYQAYGTSLPWTLSSGAGTKTVSVWFRDVANVTSPVKTDTIVLDTTAPTNGTVFAAGDDTAVDLTWSGFADAGAGIASYIAVQATGATAPANCNGTAAWTGTTTAATLSGLVNGTTYAWRVCAVDGAGNISSGAVVSATPAPEYTAPTGTISLNAGADFANNRVVTATLAATDTSGVASACLSNTATCSTWFTMAGTKSWTLTSGGGVKTVYAFYKDIYGNISTVTSDSITLDTTVPTNGTVTAVGDDTEIELTWSGFADTAGSGITSYKVVQATGLTAPTNCSGTAVWTGSTTTTTIASLTNGTSYAFRVCAVDAAGNVSTGASVSARPAPEYTAPTGTIAINAGAAYTNTAAVTVTLSATDASGVGEACLSNTTTCATWFAMAGTKSWTLASGAGTKTVNAWYKDIHGNVSALTSDAIVVDTTVPANGTVTAAGDDGAVDLSWTGFTDASAGIASYSVYQATGLVAPANCNGSAVASSSTGSVTVSGLTNGTAYSFRVCATDNAGNKSTGSVVTATPAPEYTAPTGSISINAGAAFTKLTASTVTLTATDDTSVAFACLSNTATCTTWFAMTGTKSWTLPSGAGLKTVNGWYKDTYGNISAMVSDTITIDTTAPVNGTVSAVGDDGEVDLTWTGFSDASAGIASYDVYQATGLVAPACTGTAVYSGTDLTANVASLTNGTTYSFRVCATDNAGNKSSGAIVSITPAPEYAAPTGSISINAGAAFTNLTATTVTLTATDDTSVAFACLSNTATCSTWFAMAGTKSWTLTTGVGLKTVNGWYKDPYGNVSAMVSDSITVDTTAPVTGTVTATGDDTEVELVWTGFSDASAGIATYNVYQATGTVAPTSCSGTPVYTGTDTTTTIASLTNGTNYAWRVCAVDNAGNTSTGATATARPGAEFTAPTGTISINAAAAFTNSTTSTVTLSATDDTAVTEACLSNTATCTTWFAMTGSKSWVLTTGAGLKTVSGWFKDADGNVSTVATDTITVDVTAPTNGTATAAGDDAEVVLSWSGFADAAAGVASYKVVQATGVTAPTNCSGTAAWTGTATTATISSLTNGTTYAWRVCAIDNAGNLSTGASVSARPAPEYVVPTGTVVLNAAATHTNVTGVTATLSATDDTSVAEACLSNTTTCTTWFPMTASKSWTLATGAGTKTVNAWFKDPYGNVSALVSDTIIVDVTKPVDGALTATGDDAEIDLSWVAATDTAGIASYKVVYDAAVPATGCTTGTVAYTGTATSTTITGLTNGATYSTRVCAFDNAGNVSNGGTSTTRVAPEYVAPTGTIVLNGGAAWTSNRILLVTLSATDDTSVSDMCISATGSCTAWVPYTTSTTFSASTTAGTKTVNAWFRDHYGNVSVIATDTIGYDQVAPTGGTVTATPDDTEIDLSWTGFTDATSGIASYKVVYKTGAAPLNCSTGTIAYSGTATSASITGLVNGTAYGVRVCAVDNADKVSTGATATATPAP